MATKVVRKVTLSLDVSLVEQVQQAIKKGEAKSQTDFVEEALRMKLEQIERGEWRQAMIDASNDPLFLADVEEVMKDFEYADAESARMIE